MIWDIQLIAIVTAVACAVPGVFLVLKKMSMMSDSITHTVLLGIVLAFFITHNLSSPLLIAGAAAIGVVTVWLTETLHRSKLLSEESSIGLVFPLLFSIAIILITRYAGQVHLDTDAVLSGNLVFAQQNRLVIAGVDIGPQSLYVMGIILLLNVLFVTLLFKELKVSTFDPPFAYLLGFAPVLLHYALMSLVSITAVGAFEAVGSILVVAFMAGPPATAYLLTHDLKKMIWLTVAIAAFNAIAGYQLSIYPDISVSGSMAAMTGLTFAAVFIFAPQSGLISIIVNKKRQKLEFAKNTVLFHIKNHETEENVCAECGIASIKYHLKWQDNYSKKITDSLLKERHVFIKDHILHLTKKGREHILAVEAKIFGDSLKVSGES